MTEDFHYALAEFGPSEVARLTGVSPELQRDWRRRGIIVMEMEGRARFYLDQVCQILLMKAAADLGVPLAEARTGAVFSSVILQFLALSQDGALDFDPAIPAAQRESASMAQLPGTYGYLVVCPPGLTPELIKQLTGKEVGPHLQEMLPLWPATDWETVGRTAKSMRAFGVSGFGVIDLEGMAVKLARDVERPLATVRPGPSAGANRTIRAALGEPVE